MLRVDPPTCSLQTMCLCVSAVSRARRFLILSTSGVLVYRDSVEIHQQNIAIWRKTNICRINIFTPFHQSTVISFSGQTSAWSTVWHNICRTHGGTWRDTMRGSQSRWRRHHTEQHCSVGISAGWIRISVRVWRLQGRGIWDVKSMEERNGRE